MEKEQSLDYQKDKRGLEKFYHIPRINLDDVFNPNGIFFARGQERWNTKFKISTEPGINIFDQTLRALSNGEYQPYQKEDIQSGDLAKAWKETLETALSHIIDNAAEGRDDSIELLLGKKMPNISINVYKRNDFLIIEVKDDGEGIPSHILEGFNQKKPRISTKSEGRGGGFGLIATREAIAQLGGSLEIETVRIEEIQEKQHSGTTIRFVFQMNTPRRKNNLNLSL